jgi:cellulose synthase/poly-beta-1,6-N-acetylglucosamine synthase-like glycosyltransferase
MSNDGPKICVLIPAFNEARVIEGTLDSLRDAGFECRDIYVVDDMSSDATAALARRRGANVYTVPEKGGCKANAQNHGLAHFQLQNKYDWVVFVDADSKVESQFLNAMYEAAETHPDATLLIGQVKSAKNNHICAALRAYEYTFSHEVIKGGQANFNMITVSPGCASMYKLADLMKLNIDSGTLAEDMDLTIQVHRMKGKIKYIHAAGVSTQDPSTFKDYMKQNMRWNRGFWQIILKHKTFAFTKKLPVDWYMMYLVLDTLLLNRLFTLPILCWLFPLKWVGFGVLVDMLCYLGVGVVIALKTKRWDVLCKVPIFYWLAYLNLYAFLSSFVEIILCRKKILAWNKVQRYDFITT